MSSPQYRLPPSLLLALALSLLIHGLPFIGERLTHSRAVSPPAAPPLTAHLRVPPPPPLPLSVPEAAKAAPPPAPVKRPPRPPEPAKPAQPAKPIPRTTAPAPRNWQSEVRRQLRRLHEEGRFYPAEAIAQGLEGEATVLLIVDEAGNVVAARLEQGTGHRILDEAALRAARALKALPADAPRETVLPIRFRLR